MQQHKETAEPTKGVAQLMIATQTSLGLGTLTLLSCRYISQCISAFLKSEIKELTPRVALHILFCNKSS